MIWIILGFIAGISLIIFGGKKSAVWGGLTLGILVGLIISIVGLIKGNGFNLAAVGKSAVVGTIIGLAAESLGKFGNLFKRGKHDH
jgi:hypothetical protein